MSRSISKREKLEIDRISEKYKVPAKDIEQIIKSQYEFIRQIVHNLELPRNLTEEEFNNHVKNFNIPSIGKFYASYSVYKRINKL